MGCYLLRHIDMVAFSQGPRLHGVSSARASRDNCDHMFTFFLIHCFFDTYLVVCLGYLLSQLIILDQVLNLLFLLVAAACDVAMISMEIAVLRSVSCVRATF